MKKFLSLALALCLLLCGCGNGAEETTKTTTTAPVETTAAETTTTESSTPTQTTEATLQYSNPLTGEALEEEYTGRPFGVMINNAKSALPQCGIGQVDILYEVLAEGSVTRFMALFTDVSDAGPIGPVRSLRPYFLNVMRGYDALITSAGGSAEATEMVYNLDRDWMDGINGTSGAYFYRDAWRRENRGYEHSLFIKGEDLLSGAQKLGMRTDDTEGWDYGLSFTDEVLKDGETAEKLVMHFYSGGKTTTMAYNADTGCYVGSQQGYALMDGNTEEVIPFRNVLVLLADTRSKDEVGHLEVQTTGEGTGWYARDGKMIEITWSREKEDASFRYFDADGEPLSLGVGKTYVAILPKGDYKLDCE